MKEKMDGFGFPIQIGKYYATNTVGKGFTTNRIGKAIKIGEQRTTLEIKVTFFGLSANKVEIKNDKEKISINHLSLIPIADDFLEKNPEMFI